MSPFRPLPDAVRTIVEGRSNRYDYSDQWPSLKSAAEREFAELNQRLPELQREYDEALAVVEAPLDYYSDPKYREND